LLTFSHLAALQPPLLYPLTSDRSRLRATLGAADPPRRTASSTPIAERRLYFEAALANMEQSLFVMRDNLNNHTDVAIAVPSTEDEESVDLDDVSTEMDDDGEVMSPRGIYMRRCQ